MYSLSKYVYEIYQLFDSTLSKHDRKYNTTTHSRTICCAIRPMLRCCCCTRFIQQIQIHPFSSTLFLQLFSAFAFLPLQSSSNEKAQCERGRKALSSQHLKYSALMFINHSYQKLACSLTKSLVYFNEKCCQFSALVVKVKITKWYISWFLFE